MDAYGDGGFFGWGWRGGGGDAWSAQVHSDFDLKEDSLSYDAAFP